jgi:dihydrofolate reductase
MRRIVVATFVSLDGIMQAPGGPEEDPTGSFAFGGWTAPYFDEALGASLGAIFGRPFDLLLGRKTYDIFAAHWPYATGADEPIAKTFNEAAKYVASRSDRPLAWRNSRWLGGESVEEICDLKSVVGM